MADGAAERSHPGVDERLQMVPVLVGLGIKDEIAVSGRELPETAIATGRATLPRRAGPSTTPGREPRGLPRMNPTSRYQNIFTARPTAAATPMVAERSMLPVPGSR